MSGWHACVLERRMRPSGPRGRAVTPWGGRRPEKPCHGAAHSAVGSRRGRHSTCIDQLAGDGASELGDGRRVVSVAFQQAPEHPVDDLVVSVARPDEREPSRVLCGRRSACAGVRDPRRPPPSLATTLTLSEYLATMSDMHAGWPR